MQQKKQKQSALALCGEIHTLNHAMLMMHLAL